MKKTFLLVIIAVVLSGCIPFKATVPDGYVLIREVEIDAMTLNYWFMEQQLRECEAQLEKFQGEEETF